MFLLLASSQVVLTVQQRAGARSMGSPSLHNRSLPSPSSTRITGPQPVDVSKHIVRLCRREKNAQYHHQLYAI